MMSCFLSLSAPPPRSTLFPYTTLFRSDVRACTCAGLSDLGPSAAEAIPAVVTCLKETNHAVFSSALNAVSSMREQGLPTRSEEHTSELQSPYDLVCRLLLEKKKKTKKD